MGKACSTVTGREEPAMGLTRDDMTRHGSSRDELLVLMLAFRAWQRSVSCSRRDLDRRLHEFQLCSIAFNAWSSNIREIRNIREQELRHNKFMQSFANEQNSLHGLREALEELRNDFVFRERDVNEREIKTRQDSQRMRMRMFAANTEMDVAKSRAEAAFMCAKAEELACDSAKHEALSASALLAHAREENQVFFEECEGMAQQLIDSEDAVSRETRLVGSLRNELQGLQHELGSESRAAAWNNQEFASQLQQGKSELQALREQAASQGTAFLHMAGEHAALQRELQKLHDAKADVAEAQAKARADLHSEAMQLEASQQELQMRKQRLDLHVENAEHRSNIAVKAVRDQAEQQNREYMRLFLESEEQQKEISSLRSEAESTHATMKQLQLLKATLDQREFDLGKIELNLNLREKRILAKQTENVGQLVTRSQVPCALQKCESDESPSRRRVLSLRQTMD